MMRQSQRTRLGRRLRIEVARGVAEVVPEVEGEAVSEVVDGDVEEEEVSRLEGWKVRMDHLTRIMLRVAR